MKHVEDIQIKDIEICIYEDNQNYYIDIKNDDGEILEGRTLERREQEMNEKQYEYYLQIDYIDNDGNANYISTFHDIKDAMRHHEILQNAQSCIDNYEFYVLDLYRYELNSANQAIEDTDELIMTIKSGNNTNKIFEQIREL